MNFLKQAIISYINNQKVLNAFNATFKKNRKNLIKVRLSKEHIEMLYTLLINGITTNKKLKDFLNEISNNKTN